MKIYCLLGDERVFKSLSPLMHNTVMKEVGWDGLYVPFAVAPSRVDDALKGIRALGIQGANVTIPLKELVVPCLDEISEVASSLGAVNTLVRRGEILRGENTDVGGFVEAVERTGVSLDGGSVLVVGAGGAARAVILGVRMLGASRVVVANRTPARGTEVANRLQADSVPLDRLPQEAFSAQVLINATAVSRPEEGAELASMVERLRMPHCRLVFDLNYGRRENIWGRLAEKEGVPFVDGLPMLAYQAARSFRLWTGMDVDGDRFLAILRSKA